jgi:hypothetical protein
MANPECAIIDVGHIRKLDWRLRFPNRRSKP